MPPRLLRRLDLHRLGCLPADRPSVFGEASDTSFVRSRPVGPDDRHDAPQTLLACPTGSIGCLGGDDVKAVMANFPLPVEGPVYSCGYNSPQSYGGNSYLVRHPDGNWLVDSARFVAPLVRRIEAMGGIGHIFLTHRDDVADAGRYAAYFGARRIIHRDEPPSQLDAEVVLDGEGPWRLAPDFLAVPTPGADSVAESARPKLRDDQLSFVPCRHSLSGESGA